MGAIGSLASLAKLFFGDPPVRASLVPLDGEGNEYSDEERGFQYFPETVSDNKGANWVAKNIPGGSHPLYQFINGTERNLSFAAVFTNDEKPPSDGIGGFFDKMSKGFSLASLLPDKTGLKKKHVVDIKYGLVWLRQFIYPTYEQGYCQPPPTLRLYLPNSGIYGAFGDYLMPDAINVIMTRCDIVYEAFYRAGHPRIAVVNLEFSETIQVGNEWRFTDGTLLNEEFNSGEYKVKAIMPEQSRETSG